MGFLVSQHGQLGAIPPPPFLSVSPLESMRSGGVMPPPKGVSQRYLRDTLLKQGKWVRYPPLRYYLERVLRDRGGYLALLRAGLWAPRCYDRHLHAHLDCLRFAAVVWHAVCSRQQRWSRDPSRDRPLGRRTFSRRFCAHFWVTLEHLLLKRQSSEETAAENLRKHLRKNLRIAHQKSVHENLCKKSVQKSAHQKQCKNCAKDQCEDSVSLEDESPKKTQKTNQRQII